MSVALEPAELGFRRPFTQEVSEILRLHNPGSDAVAFKVKTTAPKQYCVRPNSGKIESGGTVEVQVLLQAMKEDPPLDAKCRDKFLVQSVAIAPGADASNVAAIWGSLDGAAKSQVEEKKIRVNFLPADGSAVTPARKSLGAIADDEAPSYGSPASVLGTPAAMAGVAAAAGTPASTSTSSTVPVGAVSRSESRPEGAKNSTEAARSASNPATSSSYTQAVSNAASSSVASAASAAGTSTEELKAQLSAAQAQISKLTAQAAEQTGLRQRKVGESEKVTARDPSTAQAIQTAPGGVPVPVVAALCLLCFLLAYLLF